MKTTFYILVFLFLGTLFTACTPETQTDESNHVESTWGEDGSDPEDDDE